MTTSLYPRPVNYRGQDGAWYPIDSALVATDEPGYAWRNRANSFRAYFKPDLAEDFLGVQVGHGFYRFSSEGASRAAAVTSGRRVEYPNAFAGTRLRYDVTATGVKETLVLSDRTARSRYRFFLTPPPDVKVRAERAGAGWEVYSELASEPVFSLAPPVVAETVAGEVVPVEEQVATLDVTEVRGRLALDLAIDPQWLADPARGFPLLVDPTISVGPVSDVEFIVEDCCLIDPTSPLLRVGTDLAYAFRSALKFDMGGLPAGINISRAALSLNVQSCGMRCPVAPEPFDALRMTSQWTPATVRSATFDPTPVGSVNLVGPLAGGWVSWDITATARSWYLLTQPNYGVLLKRRSELIGEGEGVPADYRFHSSRATEPALAPRLDVTWSGGVQLAAPDTLHANGAELEWTRYDATGAPAFDRYEIHRSTDPAFTPSAATLIASFADQTVTRYRDTTAAPQRSFTYKVSVAGIASNAQTVTLPAAGQAQKTLQPGPAAVKMVSFPATAHMDDCATYGHGADQVAFLSPADPAQRALLAFDLRDVGLDVDVLSATLSLRRLERGTAPQATVSAHRVTSAWEEGTTTGGAGCLGNGADWWDRKLGVTWKTAGGDYESTVVASVTIPAGSYDPAWDSFNVTSLVGQWLEGDAPNLGLLLTASNPVSYYTDDFTAAPTLRPKLTITYTDTANANPPAVAIVEPRSGTLARGTVSVSAATRSAARISKVELFANGSLVGTDTTEPYAFTWDSTTLPRGTQVSLTTNATDDAGSTTTSAPVAVTIANSAPPTVSVSPPAGGAGYRSSVLADNPAAYWRLGEPAGTTTAADSAGNGNAGTYVNNPTLGTAGALTGDSDTSVTFDGSHVTFGDVFDFTGTAPFTVEAWVKPTLLDTNNRRILSKKGNDGSGLEQGYVLVVTNSSTTFRRYAGGVNKAASWASGLGVGQWSHIAGTYDGTALRLYVNGVLRATNTTATGALGDHAAPFELARLSASSGYFKGAIDEAAVYARALSATEIQEHYDAASSSGSSTLAGTVTLAAAASDDHAVRNVTFFVDGVRVGEDATAPYAVSWNTTDPALPAYDGDHELTARAEDDDGQTTTSVAVTATVDNAGASIYRATLAAADVPPIVVYDPALATQDDHGTRITVTNSSQSAWTSSVSLRARWLSPDAAPTITDGSSISLGAGGLAAGASTTITANVKAPALPDGVDSARYTLRFDLYDSATGSWFAANGSAPAEIPVLVRRAVTGAGLGLERYYHYHGEELGAGMQHLVNLANGNSLVRWTPFSAPGRGLSTVVDLTYNSREQRSESPAGNNFSLAISTLTRFGLPLDVHPNAADTRAGRTAKFIDFTDGDGTSHRFTGKTAGDGGTYWEEPAGVHLYLRQYSTTDTTRKWALTRPDGVTFFYDTDGYPTFVEDRNGNKLAFTLEPVPPGQDAHGLSKRITAVTDAAGLDASPAPNRRFTIDYLPAADAITPALRGKIARISDHGGHALEFAYYDDGNLLRLTERGGTTAGGFPLADRSFTFTYTTPGGGSPAIADPTARANPDPRLTTQSSRLYSVRDPRGTETTFAYTTAVGANQWKLASRTDRTGAVTAFSYETANANTPPTATPDNYTATQDTAKTVAAPGVLANDGDPDGDAITAVKITNPGHGTVTLNANGSFTYTPAAGYTGPDSFTYKTVDSNDGESTAATVTITVAAAGGGTSQTLRAGDDAFVRSNYPTENNGSETTIRAYKSGANETWSYLKFTVPSSAGTVTQAKLRLYVTDASAVGGSIYQSLDTSWSESTITWSNKPVAAATAIGSFGAATLNTWVEVDVSSLIGGPGTYTLVLKDGSSDVARYGSDESANQPQLVVTSGSPTGGNTAPTASADSYAVTEDTPKTVALPGVLANDTDPDGDPLTATKITNPSHGTVTLNANGSFTYTPATGYTGSDSFTYKAVDSSGAQSNAAAVTLTIDPPAAARTTVTAPLARISAYLFDGEGKVARITNAANEQTAITWSGDRHVTKVTEPTGSFTEYAYNANGYLKDVWDQLRNRTTLAYEDLAVDANDVSGKWKPGRSIPHLSRLKTKTDPKGTATATPTNDFQWTFDYDARSNVTKVTDPDEKATTYAYNADGTLASTTDANLHTTTFVSYDANGLPTEVRDAAGSTTRLGYDDNGLVLWVQDPMHPTIPAGADPRHHRATFDYDSFHRLGRQSAPKSSALEPGNLIWSAADYDANDNLVAQIAPHYGTQYSGLGATTTTVYDAMDRPTLVTGPDRSADPAGERTKFVYDAAGRIDQIVTPKGMQTATPSNDYSTFYTYDALDRVIREATYAVDANGAITKALRTHYCYDTAGDLRRVTAPKAGLTSVDCAAAPPAFTTQHEYDDAHRLTATTDARGRRRSLTYDGNGNVATATNQNGDTTTYTYDERDQLTTTVEPFDPARTPQPRVLTTKYEYDAVGNLKRLISPRGWDNAPEPKTTFTYFVTGYQYDNLDRLVRVDLPIASGETQLYRHHGYDASGNLTMTSLPVATVNPAAVAAEQKTTVEYYDTGWIRTSKDAATAKVSFDYTAEGRQASRAPADAAGVPDRAKTMYWTYEADGLLREVKDAAGQGQRLSYDANDNLLGARDINGLTVVGETALDIAATYDAFDRLTQIRHRKLADNTYRFTLYAYDDNGNIETRTDDRIATTPDAAPGTVTDQGRLTEFVYDQTDWLESQLARGSDPATVDDEQVEYSYLPTGWVSRELVRRDGVEQRVTDKSYFANGQLKTLDTRNRVGGTLLESHTLGYEGTTGNYVDGHRTKDVFQLVGPDAAAPCRTAACTATYAYDGQGRLVQDYDGHSTTTYYTLDPAGNIVSEQRTGGENRTRTFSYTANQLRTSTDTVAGSRSYFHDREGNLECVTTSGGPETPGDCTVASGALASSVLVHSYSYDYLNRLESVRTFDARVERDKSVYDYDALDRPVRQTERHGATAAPQTTLLQYIGLSSSVDSEARKDHEGTLLGSKRYGYDAYGELVSLANTPAGQATERLTYSHDPHHSVSLLVTQAGTARASYGYTAYGRKDAALTNGDTAATAPLNPYRYTGKRLDTGSGTLEMGARRFSADIGRFLQSDLYYGGLANLVLGFDPLTANRYALAAGNPVSFVEVDGHYVIGVDEQGNEYPIPPSATSPLSTPGTEAGADDEASGGDGPRGLFAEDIGDWGCSWSCLPMAPPPIELNDPWTIVKKTAQLIGAVVGTVKGGGRGRKGGSAKSPPRGAETVAEISKKHQWGQPSTLVDHYRRHGDDFGATGPADYARRAHTFFVRGKERNLPTKVDDRGVIRMYDPRTNTFGSYNPDGTTRTFFKPSPPGYWKSQPGKPKKWG